MSKNIDFKHNPTILNDYLEYLKNTRNYSIGTINGYELDLKIFFNFILRYKDIPIEFAQLTMFNISQIKYDDIVAYIVYLNYHNNNCSNTRQRKVAAIKSFFKWFYAQKNFIKKENPTKKLPHIQKLQTYPKYLTLNQAKNIQSIFNENNCKQYIRNNAILTLFLSTGIRLSELVNINLEDINFTEKTIKICCKGNKERIIFFSEYCKKKMLEYLNLRDTNNCKTNALFIGSRNKRICRNSIEYICKKAYKLMGLEDKNYTVHSLRHTAATIYFEYNNRDILLLKEILGHSTILSTEIYTHTYNDLVKEAVMKNPLSEYGIT